MNHTNPGRCCADAGGCNTCQLNPRNIERAARSSYHPKPGDRVKVMQSDGIFYLKTGTVCDTGDFHGIWVHLDCHPDTHVLFRACDLELIPAKIAPAQPGEWRDYPDGPGWWVKRNPPSDEPHWVWERPLVYHQAEPAGYDGIHKNCWLRLPDKPPEG